MSGLGVENRDCSQLEAGVFKQTSTNAYIRLAFRQSAGLDIDLRVKAQLGNDGGVGAGGLNIGNPLGGNFNKFKFGRRTVQCFRLIGKSLRDA